MEVEKWRETVNQASPAFAISRRTAARKRSLADGTGAVSKDVMERCNAARPEGLPSARPAAFTILLG